MSENNKAMLIIFGGMILIALVMAVVSGWTDLEQNKIITECIRAGKTWKDGNCG